MSSNIESFIVKDEYLLIIAKAGVRKSLIEIANGADNLAKLVEETKKDKIIFDYREVTFEVNTADAFNVVRYYEKLLPFASVKAASVVNAETEDLASRWIEYARKRKFRFRHFLDMEKAERWLLSDEE